HLSLRRAQLDLQQSHQRLREMEKLRDDLVHMIVHDMRSPLTALIARLDFLETDLASTLKGKSKEDLKHAVDAALAAARRADDLLAFSRREPGKLPPDRKPVELAKVAGEVRASLAGMEKGRILELDAPAAVSCFCDGKLVRRVMQNLLSNAIKHTPQG